jgi:Uma2 family endonuclease
MAAPVTLAPEQQAVPTLPPEAIPCVDNLVTEDDTPVDNVYSEKQQRLLTEPLYSSWPSERSFLAAANVGMFYAVSQPPLVPDAFLSMDVQAPHDLWAKKNRSYFFWEYGKAPEVVIEVVSNREGGEADVKLQLYAKLRIPYYVIWDPSEHLRAEPLRLFTLQDQKYVSKGDTWLPAVGLSLSVWQGVFEGVESGWLRWCDKQGQVIPTGAEKSLLERERAEQERERAEQERERAEQERERAARLIAQLRALGIEPTNGRADV